MITLEVNNMAKLKPFVKWAGGKEKELPIILDNLPQGVDRYIEPFVGGGAVYLNIDIIKSIINDKSDELMLLYKMIKERNAEFLKGLEDINKNWLFLERMIENRSDELLKIYYDYKERNENLDEYVEQ